MEAYLIFDIGKTNKKAILYNPDFEILEESSMHVAEIQDDDGFPCDDLMKVSEWVLGVTEKFLKDPKYRVIGINFSAYGASLVHIDETGKVCAPFYNYLKPVPETLWEKFLAEEENLLQKTASPALRMLNSGFQLYWLKHEKLELFKKIRFSFHLPQYFSFLLTGEKWNDYTGVGCHTCFWDFEKKDFAHWVKKTQIEKILPPFPTETGVDKNLFDQKVKIGFGMHDSSAALLPYIRLMERCFVLISTGTWSISLNPFDQETLTAEELESDCLSFLQPDGRKVKGARIFLGKEYEVQVNRIASHFGDTVERLQKLEFSQNQIKSLFAENKKDVFQPICFQGSGPKVKWEGHENPLSQFSNAEDACLQLMLDLAKWQQCSTDLVLGKSKVSDIILTGGFTKNKTFLAFLQLLYPNQKIYLSNQPRASALGALLALDQSKLKQEILRIREFETGL
jgi:sugar (pentulose or hexulose) kinase